MKRNRFCLAALAISGAILLGGCGGSGGSGESTQAEEYEPTLASLGTHPVPEWWQDARFGIFIHWGPYSVPAYAPLHKRNGEPLGELDAAPECSPLSAWYWFFQQSPLFPGDPMLRLFYDGSQWCDATTHRRDTYGEPFVYDDFIPQFRAQNWDPAQWVRAMHDSGARYFVLTAKHHDGFALWPTAVTDRNAMAMGPRRDLIADLFQAADELNADLPAGQRLRPALYYSLPEWYTPAPVPEDAFGGETIGAIGIKIVFGGDRKPHNAFTGEEVPYTGYKPIRDYAAGQVRPQLYDLIDRYHPDVLWCDVGGNEAYFRSNEVIAYYYNQARRHNPEGVVVNNRCGDPDTTHYDFVTPEYAETITDMPPLEVTRGMGTLFAFNREAELADAYQSSTELVKSLAEAVAYGGNLLLGIGPRADGTIPEHQLERLRDIGVWLRRNGEAIYGSRQWIQTVDEAGNFFTRGADDALYVIATGRDERTNGDKVRVAAPLPLDEARTRITLVGGDGAALAYTRSASGFVITLPSSIWNAHEAVHVPVLRIAAD